MVGMDHLRHAVEQLDLARDKPPFAHRQLAFNPALAGVKENQLQIRPAITAVHTPGPSLCGWLAVTLNGDRDRDNLGGDRIGQMSNAATADTRMRQVQDQIAQPRHAHLGKGLGRARANARQRLNAREQGKQYRRAARRYPWASVSHSSSSMTLMPSSAAFLALEPAPGPAISRSVLAETEPATWAPSASARALASARVIFSSVPVKTSVLPAMAVPVARASGGRIELNCAISRSIAARSRSLAKASDSDMARTGPIPSAAIRSAQAFAASGESSLRARAAPRASASRARRPSACAASRSACAASSAARWAIAAGRAMSNAVLSASQLP